MLWWWWNQKLWYCFIILIPHIAASFIFKHSTWFETITDIFLKCTCFLVAHNYWYIQTIKSSALEILLLCFHVFYLLAILISFMVAFLYFSFFWWMEHYYLSKKRKEEVFGLLACTDIFFPCQLTCWWFFQCIWF